MSKGVKFDNGKPMAGIPYQQFPLVIATIGLSTDEIDAVRECGEYGLEKYPDRFNWREVGRAADRYIDAGFRHLKAIQQGEDIDPESLIEHWKHALWNGCAVLELILERMAGVEYLPSTLILIGVNR